MSDIDCGVPIGVENNTVGTDVPATVALAVTAVGTTVHLARVHRGNCFHLLARKWCLVSQYALEFVKGNLRQGVVVPHPLVTLTGTGGF